MTPKVHVAHLVDLLSRTPEAKWSSVVLAELMAHRDTYTFLSEVSVERAMRDAGASEELVSRVVTMLEGHRFVPRSLRIRE